MATVFWKGKQWVAQWYRPDGSRVKRGTGCAKRREAEREAADMETKDRKAKDTTGQIFEAILSRAVQDAKAGKLSADRSTEYMTELRRVTDPEHKTISLAEQINKWCAEKKGRVKPKTASGYEDMQRRMKKSLGPTIMSAPVEELTRLQIERALRKLKEDGLRSSTVNLDLRALRQCLKQAMEDGLVTRNAAAGIKSLAQDDSTERAPFTAEEVRQMIDHPKTSEEWQGMILFGAHTGLRLGDIAGISADHIDGTELVIRPKKTDRSRKTIRIPLTPPLLAWISTRTGAFFPTLAKKATPTLSMQFSAIMKRAGVPASIVMPGALAASRSFHSLRHSFTSWLADADIHADVRQKLTGHSSSSVHAKYTHHDASLARAIATLPDLTPAKSG